MLASIRCWTHPFQFGERVDMGDEMDVDLGVDSASACGGYVCSERWRVPNNPAHEAARQRLLMKGLHWCSSGGRMGLGYTGVAEF